MYVKDMRTGPKPLMTHIGLALSAGAQQSDNPQDVQEYAQKMLQGIRKYQMHDFKREVPDREVLWQAGQASVLKFEAKGQNKKPPAFIVPSMVNRAYILDLMDGQSFCAWLSEQGHQIYLLDWGEPTQDDGLSDIDVLMDQRLIPSLKACAEDCGSKLHVLGYCMGGTFAAALAQIAFDHVASLCMLAAPWDFHSGGGDLSKWVEFWTPAGLTMIAQNGYLPSDWIQTVFASLDPFQTAQKFSHFADMDDDDLKAQIFVAVEDWLNDAVPLPGELARICLYDWFQKNVTYTGEWQVLGHDIRPAELDIPVLIAASENDRLVPYASSIAFQSQQTDILKCACGHIGFMASQKAQNDVWTKISQFFAGQV